MSFLTLAYMSCKKSTSVLLKLCKNNLSNSTTKSEYLLDNPITIYYEQMIKNYAPNTWKSLLRFPSVDELPNYGPWWNWSSELENINKVIDYLGNTLGKFETHFVAATPIINPLIWVIKQKLGNESYLRHTIFIISIWYFTSC